MRTINVGGNQGRSNPPAFRPHRLNEQDIPGLEQRDGGTSFRDGWAFPIEAEDEPVTTPAQAMTWPIWIGAVLLFLLFTAFAFSYGVPNWGVR